MLAAMLLMLRQRYASDTSLLPTPSIAPAAIAATPPLRDATLRLRRHYAMPLLLRCHAITTGGQWNWIGGGPNQWKD